MRMTFLPFGRVLTLGALASGLAVAAPLGSSGCATPASRIIVPADILRGPTSDAIPRSRYVVRMTNGDQDWELQLPEIATAYEVRIPLRGQPVGGVEQSAITAADREIVAEREAESRARGDEEGPADADDDDGGRASNGKAAGKSPGKPSAREATGKSGGGRGEGAEAAPTRESPRASYLLTLAKVKELYRTRHYEVALVELVALERQYPDDERILSMKGSLYEKLGKRELARAAWQSVLALNPYNLQVAEALQRLEK